jgi:hypothetical protein
MGLATMIAVPWAGLSGQCTRCNVRLTTTEVRRLRCLVLRHLRDGRSELNYFVDCMHFDE